MILQILMIVPVYMLIQVFIRGLMGKSTVLLRVNGEPWLEVGEDDNPKPPSPTFATTGTIK